MVSFTTTSTPGVCSAGGLNGASITFLSTGLCTIVAAQAGDASWAAATSMSRNVSVSKATQSITFANPGGNKTMLDSPLAVSATSTSGLVVSFTTTSTPGVCSAGGLNGASITFLSTGLCTIVAAQAGDASWAAAAPRSRNVTISKATQSITFAAIGPKIFAQLYDVVANASASSGLVVILSSTTPTLCTVSGTHITLVAIGTCTLTASQAGNAAYNPASATRSFNITKTILQVSGNLIVSPSGEPVRLIGVNRAGSEYMCIQNRGFFEGPSNDASVLAMAQWHANAVRVPLNEDCWLGINGPTSPPSWQYGGAAYRSAITAYVALLKSHGLVAILELHWSAAGTTAATTQHAMPDKDHSVAFWTSVATTFKGDPNVVFDLFNEPFPDDNRDSTTAWQCWRDGGAACVGHLYTVPQNPDLHTPDPFAAVGMQELVNAVRGTNATNVILVGGVRFANAMSQWLAYKPVDATGNLAASWHVYPFNYPDPRCTTVTCWDSNWDSNVLPTLNTVPLVATEIGQTDCGAGFINTVMPWLDSHGSGYLAWTWDVPFGCQSLITDYAGTPTPTYGAAFRDHLLSIRP